MDERVATAFVLSGGASLGAIQAGMLQALYERRIKPDLLVGTSAGALNAAFVASRPQTVRTASELGEIWCSLRRGDAFPVNPVTGLLGIVGARAHLVPASGLERIIDAHLQRDRLEELPIPVHVVVVDVLSGEEILLSRGPLGAAVLASASIPAVFAPVPWGDRLLMDGSVANNAPISHAVELGARRVYVLPTGHSCALETLPRGALATAVHAVSLLTQQRLIADIERHREDVELIVLPPPCPQAVTPVDFSHAEELIARGLEGARRFLEEGGAESSSNPLRMHSHAG